MSENETSQKEDKNSWFSGLSWRTALIIAGISMMSGGGTGGVVATKGVQAQTSGISQDQADVRYMSKEAADKRIELRNIELKDMRKEMLTRDVFDAYHKTDSERMDRMERMMQQILENQNRFK